MGLALESQGDDEGRCRIVPIRRLSYPRLQRDHGYALSYSVLLVTNVTQPVIFSGHN